MKENYCIICGRKIGGKSSTKYCKKHLNQIQKYGKVLDNNPRNKFDPNEFRFIGNDIVEFDTYDVIGNVVATYKIDAEDYPLVSKYKWRTIKGYASHGSSINYLHRLVTHAKDGQQVDHINLDITDNRKCNLRIVTRSQNGMNRGVQSNNKTGVTGVTFYEPYDKWNSQIALNGKHINLGYFSDFEDAVQCYTVQEHGINTVVTRNIKDYKTSGVLVQTPEVFLSVNGFLQ